MGRRHGIFSLALLLAQLQPVPFAMAQGFGSGLGSVVPGTAGGFTQDWGYEPPAQCVSEPVDTPPLPIKPLDKDASAQLVMMIAADGRVADAMIQKGSGDDARDNALLAHARANWHYRPLSKNCKFAKVRVTSHYLHVTCAPRALEETQTSPNVKIQDHALSVEIAVAVVPDGSVTNASVTRSSGDAALDAAAVSHVKEAWRWEPYSCPTAKPPVMGSVTVAFPFIASEP